MQIIAWGLALLTSLSVFAKTEWPRQPEDIPFDAKKLIEFESERLRCGHYFMRDFQRIDPVIRKVKLELVAEAICSNPQILHQFLEWKLMDEFRKTGVKREMPDYSPPFGQPVMVVLHRATQEERRQVTRALQWSLFPGQFNRDNANVIDITHGIRPYKLNKSQQNVLFIDVDEWIVDQEANFRTDLLKWISKMKEHKDILVVGVAAARYDAAYYARTGHPEVAAFLAYFKSIHFDEYPPQTCQEYL